MRVSNNSSLLISGIIISSDLFLYYDHELIKIKNLLKCTIWRYVLNNFIFKIGNQNLAIIMIYMFLIRIPMCHYGCLNRLINIFNMVSNIILFHAINLTVGIWIMNLSGSFKLIFFGLFSNIVILYCYYF